jgi:hypothetical protein
MNMKIVSMGLSAIVLLCRGGVQGKDLTCDDGGIKFTYEPGKCNCDPKTTYTVDCQGDQLAKPTKTCVADCKAYCCDTKICQCTSQKVCGPSRRKVMEDLESAAPSATPTEADDQKCPDKRCFCYGECKDGVTESPFDTTSFENCSEYCITECSETGVENGGVFFANIQESLDGNSLRALVVDGMDNNNSNVCTCKNGGFALQYLGQNITEKLSDFDDDECKIYCMNRGGVTDSSGSMFFTFEAATLLTIVMVSLLLL